MLRKSRGGGGLEWLVVFWSHVLELVRVTLVRDCVKDGNLVNYLLVLAGKLATGRGGKLIDVSVTD